MPTLPPVTRLYVRMKPDEIKALGDDARAERRPVADHAAYLLSRVLAERAQKHQMEKVT
jgi:hypothetical protein